MTARPAGQALRAAVALGLALGLGFGFAACSLAAPEPIPLRGPPPRLILVLPIRPPDPPGGVGPALLATVGGALRARGYDVLPIALGHSMLAAEGLAPDEAHSADRLAAATRAIGADAFLSIRVEQWRAMYAPTLVHLEHDIGYRLFDAETGALLWELRSRDVFDWDDETAFYDPGSELEQYLSPADRSEPFSPYRDDVDAARAIHRSALARLPSGPGAGAGR